MHKLFSITTILLTLFIVETFAQNSEYSQDAIQLAARLMTNKPTSEIPEHLIYSIEDALIAVSHSSYVAANAITHRYNIHAAPIANITNVRIILGKESDWGKDLTKNPLPKLFPNFELKVEHVETTDAYVVLNVFSDKPLNMKFIANEISVLDGIWMVELPSTKPTGNDVKLRKIEEGYILTYSYQTGDCGTGCGETHYWEFGVKHNGTVMFLGEHGADLAVNSTDTEDDFFTQLEELRP